MHPLSYASSFLFPMHPLSSDGVCGAFISAQLLKTAIFHSGIDRYPGD